MTSKYPECRIFLGGDFNSGTGNLYDYVIDDSVDYLPTTMSQIILIYREKPKIM